MTDPQPNRSRELTGRSLFGAFGIATLAAVPVLARGLAEGPTLDPAVFLEVGRRITLGDLPYRDVWDHKPPGIYIVNALAWLLPVTDAWIVAWLVSLAAVIVTALAVFGIVRTIGASTMAALVGAGLAAGTASAYPLSLGGGYTEPIAAMLASLSLLLLLRWPLAAVWAGGLMATSLGISLQLLPAAVAGALLALTSVRRAAAFVFGMVIVAGFAVLVMASLGILVEAVDALASYNRAYSEANRRAGGIDSGRLFITFLAMAPLGVLAALGLTRLRRISSNVTVAVSSWLVGWAALLLVQGALFEHYAVAIVPPLAILASLGVDAARSSEWRWVRPIAFGVTITVVAYSLLTSVAYPHPGIAPASSFAVAAAIRERSTQTDRVFVWGTEPEIYTYARRASAGPYIYTLPLANADWMSGDRVARLLAEWSARPPAYVVDARPEMIGDPRQGLFQAMGDHLDPLRAFIRQRYELVAVGLPFALLRRKET